MAAKKKVKRVKAVKSKTPAKVVKASKPAVKKPLKPKSKPETSTHKYFVEIYQGLAEISEETPPTSDVVAGFETFEAAKSRVIDELIMMIEHLEAHLWAAKRAESFDQYREDSLKLILDL